MGLQKMLNVCSFHFFEYCMLFCAFLYSSGNYLIVKYKLFWDEGPKVCAILIMLVQKLDLFYPC